MLDAGLFGRKMPTYADFGGWVISTIAGWFVVTADTSKAVWSLRLRLRSWKGLLGTPVPFFAYSGKTAKQNKNDKEIHPYFRFLICFFILTDLRSFVAVSFLTH